MAYKWVPNDFSKRLNSIVNALNVLAKISNYSPKRSNGWSWFSKPLIAMFLMDRLNDINGFTDRAIKRFGKTFNRKI